MTAKRSTATQWTQAVTATFLKELCAFGNVSSACRAAGVTRTAAYSRRKNNPAFAALWADALEESLDELEAALRERAIRGTDKPVYYGGSQIGAQTSFNDNLGMFLLRARRGNMYADDGRNGAADEGVDSADVEPSAVRARLEAKLEMYETEEDSPEQAGASDPRSESV